MRVVEQTALETGENEISAAKRLLEKANLADKIISGDAIFAQQELSKTVVEKGGEYLWRVTRQSRQYLQISGRAF